jgi:hypothetical protein
MKIFKNPVRGVGLTSVFADIETPVSNNAASVLKLFSFCPTFKPIPMVKSVSLANKLDVESISI